MTTGKWLIPDTLNPPETVCVQILVPNDIKHIAAFWGALNELEYAWNWEDSYEDGSTVASIWQAVIAQAALDVRNGVGCEMFVDEIRITNCILEYKIDSVWYPVVGWDASCFEGQQGIQGIQGIQGEPGEPGSGGGIAKEIRTTELIGNFTAAVDFATFEIDIPTGFDELLIHVHTASDNPSTNRILKMFFNDDTVDGNYRTTNSGGTGQSIPYVGWIPRKTSGDVDIYGFIEITVPRISGGDDRESHAFASARLSPTTNHTHHRWTHSWENTTAITKVHLTPTSDNLLAGTIISVWGIKVQEVLIPSAGMEYLVDFDGGYAYTTDSHAQANDRVDTGGNPDNCLYGDGLQTGEWVSVALDLPSSKEVIGIEFDARTWDYIETLYYFYIDGVLVNTGDILSSANYTWEHFTYDDMTPNGGNALPRTGVECKLLVAGGGVDGTGQVRIDNFKVITE